MKPQIKAIEFLEEILKAAVKKQASDIHLKVGVMPVIRKHGKLRPLAANLPNLNAEQIEQMALSLMDEEQRALFHKNKDIDLGYGISGLGRFRINIFSQRGTVRIVIRNIPYNVPAIPDLKLPPVIESISSLERGLVLVTGATGSGKSSTMAAMIDQINKTKNKHILTIEDPIEYLIRDRKSIITQRELGVDAVNFSTALRAALRQDPDVILIGELRDKETIETALTAAETGHLVLGTLHTLDAPETINRILTVFDQYQQAQIRLQLASVLRAIISQRLVRTVDNNGFIPAVEIMINNARTREMIEMPERTKDLSIAIEQSRDTWGMQSFDQHLMQLIAQKKITFDEALKHCTNPEDFTVKYNGVSQHSEGNNWDQNTDVRDKLNEQWDNIEEIEIESSYNKVSGED